MIVHDFEQGSLEWIAARCGKPTSSEFSKLVTSKGDPSDQMKGYAIQLAADLYAGEPLDRWEGNQWTERGKELEDAARAYYENSFPNHAVTQVGFISDDDETHGCSPDSLVMDEEGSEGLLEIKCLSATRHVKVLMFFDKHHRMPTEYVVQPQGQMLVAERDWCLSLFHHPDLPSLIVRNTPDEKIMINLRLQIGSCLDERDRIIQVLNKY